MNKKSIALLLSVFLAFLLPSAAMANSECNQHRCGRIKEIQQYEAQGNKTAGVVAGAVVGGVLGNQVGGGNGRKAMTVLGAIGGAVAGNERYFNFTNPTGYRVGDKVKIVDGKLVHR